MEQTLEYYLGLPYTHELIREPEGGWFVRIKELPGCMSQGDTADDAMVMIEDAMRLWIEAELRKGYAIPEPRLEEEFSGKFIVRVAKSLHKKISEISTTESVSLNQWIGTTLAEAVGENRHNLVTKRENSQEDTLGLCKVMESILTGIYAGNSELKIDEQTFSCWLDGNLEDIKTELEKHSGSQFSEKTRALLNCLSPHKEESPLINSFCKLLFVMNDIGDKYSFVINKQYQISDIISSINQPVPPKKPIPETINYKRNDSIFEDSIIREYRKSYNVGE